MVTPFEIHRKEFRRVFRGYDEQEVDEFLDRLAGTVEQLQRENEELRSRSQAAERLQKPYGNPGVRPLGMADLLQEVDEKIGELKQEVERIISSASVEAAQRAGDIVLLAESRFGELVARIEEESQRILDETEKSLERLLREAAQKFRFLINGEVTRAGGVTRVKKTGSSRGCKP
ncbi:MAG: DivIVA domain-containing protein [Bacillota bacterium]